MAADILILTIYFICVVYVLYQMALSVEANLEDQVQIVLDTDTLEAEIAPQLAQQGLSKIQSKIVGGKLGKPLLQNLGINGADTQDQILTKQREGKLSPGLLQQAGIFSPYLHGQLAKGSLPTLIQLAIPITSDRVEMLRMQVLPQGKLPLKPPIRELAVVVDNGLHNQQIFFDWDSSSLSVHGGLAYRVVRNVPGMPLDLLQPQVQTVANPNQGVNAQVTSEALFRRPEANTALESVPVLINLEAVPEMKEMMRVYSLRLLVWIKPMNAPDSQAIRLLLPFNFKIEVLPDHVALPILSWLLDWFSPAKRPRFW